MYKDVAGQSLDIGSFVVYATRTEGPNLQFGYIEEFKPSYNSHRVKLHRADANGRRKNKIESVYYPDNPSGQMFEHIDTGRPDTVWLDGSDQDKRMLVIQPI